MAFHLDFVLVQAVADKRLQPVQTVAVAVTDKRLQSDGFMQSVIELVAVTDHKHFVDLLQNCHKHYL